MKRITTFFMFMLFMVNMLAQVPQAIQYQAIVRDATDNPVQSQAIRLRISILTDSLMGQTVYTETHNVTTSNLGLVNLAIGQGSPMLGQFSSISWGSGPHYAKVEMDANLSGNFGVLTTTQLLSVPYALYAGSSAMAVMSTTERDALQNPPLGMQILNSDNFCLNVYTGNAWIAYCGTCTPQPDQAFAGPDMLGVVGTLVILQGNQPVYGSGIWSVISGIGGIIDNDSQHNSSFTGHPGAAYTLVWTISNSCGSSSDTVQIGFACDPQYIPADAGNDVAICTGGCTQLTASGGVSYLWSTQEQQVSIQVCPSQTTTYYVTVTDDYGCTAEASVTVTVNPFPNANAGQDVSICLGECTPLQASGGATYLWSTQETTADIQVCPAQTTTYTVTVTDAQGCVATDEVAVTVLPLPVANAGQDVSVCAGECTQLQASGGASYLWNTQAVTAAIEVCPAQTTTYSVTVTDAQGCIASDVVTVTVNALPMAAAGQDTAICPGDCAQLLASGGATYLWSTQATTAGIQVCPTSVTKYYLTVTDLNACSAMDSVIVEMLPLPDQANAGPDNLNIAGTTTTLQANTPVNGSGQWSIISGQGGSFADDTHATSLFTGQVGQGYMLVWTISTVCGSLSDTVMIAFPYQQSFVQCGDSLTDTRDGQFYPTVQIGTQCWMAKNLNLGTLINAASEQTNNSTIEKYCYDDNASNCDIYGGLYQWDEMMGYSTSAGAQGICPDGWHLPTDGEWCTLTTFLDPTVNCSLTGSIGTDAGGKMKDTGSMYWNSVNVGASNSSGFSALPAGYRYNGLIYFINHTAGFWSSTELFTSNGIYWLLYYYSAAVDRGNNSKALGFSVRCLLDTTLPCTPQPDQANAGPDNLNIAGTSTSLQANTPVNGSGQWSIISGLGGSFADDTLATTQFTGQAGETYELVWTISTICGSTSDTVQIGFAQTTPGFGQCGDTLTDARDGQQYPTVQIGTQCWMAKNLNTGIMVTSTNTGLNHSELSNNGVIEKYCYYNDTNYCNTYGGLYDWNEMMGYATSEGVQGICPDGWHIPTDAEFTLLSDYLGGVNVAGGKMKEMGTTHWSSPNTGASNSSGFTGLGTGNRQTTGAWVSIGQYGFLWSSTLNSTSTAWSRYLSASSAVLIRLSYSSYYGFSVRCLKDTIAACVPQPDQANAGTDQPGICSPATLSANQPSSGSGLWSVITGNNGSFSDDTDPGSTFTGDPGSSYLLLWTISNQCGSTSDSVIITFHQVPDQANAGPDNLNIAGTTTSLQANTPVNGSGQWSTISGQGGSFADANLATTQFTGQSGESYVLVWTISNACGSNSDTVQIGFAQSTPGFGQCGDTLTDARDGQQYPTVQIGTQCWMAKNLNIGVMINSISSGINHSDANDNGIIEKYCYNNDPSNCAIYGGLYDWNEMMTYVTVPGTRGICPQGWHIPTDAEFTQLSDYLGGVSVAGGKMKEMGTTHWNSPNTGASNSSGFTGLGTGNRRTFGAWESVGIYGFFWSSTLNSTSTAWSRYLSTSSVVLGRSSYSSYYGFSVRCLKDTIAACVPQPDQANAGPDNLDIAGTTASLQANTPVNGSGQWSTISGQGGSFADANLATTQFTGQSGESYSLVWTISTQCGSSSDTVLISFAAVSPGVPCPGTPTMTDFNGNVYNTVMIGTQCWMKENLKTTHYNNGVPIQNVVSDASWNILASGAYCWYNNDLTSYSATYGALYNWYAVTNSGGLCPAGWHVPLYSEWTTLVNYLGGQALAGGHLREVGTTYWNADNTGATNSSGFTALPGGRRVNYGGFESIGVAAHFWTSTNSPSMVNAYAAALITPGTSVSYGGPGVNFGLSVRCIKDTVSPCTPQPDQADAGPDNLDIAGTTTSLQANTPSNGSGLWSIISGQGGSFADANLATTLFTGQAGESYSLVWTISTQCGSTSDTVIISFAAASFGVPCPNLPTLDYEGQTYNTVLIGSQCWLRENLNVGTMVQGTVDQTDNGIIEKHCYNNDAANCATYGGLYSWNEAMAYVSSPGVRGICPPGFHIPDGGDWDILMAHLGSNAGGKMKETGLLYWNTPNTGATNESGFSARGGGFSYGGNDFMEFKEIARFWSSSFNNPMSARNYMIYHNMSDLVWGHEYPFYSQSVRCLKYDVTVQPPSQPSPINGPIDPCENDTGLIYNVIQDAGVTYTWTVPAGWSITAGQSTHEIRVTAGTASGTIEVTPSNTAGNGPSRTLGVTTQVCSTTGTYPSGYEHCDPANPTTIIDVTNPTTGNTWMDRNLGASQVATSPNDANAYGDLYQWGRFADGHQCRSSATTTQLSTTDQPGHGSFIISDISPLDWRSPQNDNLWQGFSGMNNPCPSGYRLPTDAELDSERLSWSSNNSAGAFASVLKLPVGGYRLNEFGSFFFVGLSGGYWSSTVDGIYARRLGIGSTGASVSGYQRAYGISVRCIKDPLPPCSPQPDQANAGPDNLNIPGPSPSVNLQAIQAVNGTGTWSILSGTGGSLANSTLHNTLFTGLAGESYTLVWTITNLCGSTTDTVLISFQLPLSSGQPCPGMATFEYGGQIYNTVLIGTQCWMKENLNIGTIVDITGSQSNNSIIEKFCYGNNESNCTIYGGLYQWNEVMNYVTTAGANGICPPGWHIPMDVEWCDLSVYLDATVDCNSLSTSGTNVGDKMKESGFYHWFSSNTSATNESGFTALGAGYRPAIASLGANMYGMATFWSSSQAPSGSAYYRRLASGETTIRRYADFNQSGFSVRCLRNN